MLPKKNFPNFFSYIRFEIFYLKRFPKLPLKRARGSRSVGLYKRGTKVKGYKGQGVQRSRGTKVKGRAAKS